MEGLSVPGREGLMPALGGGGGQGGQNITRMPNIYMRGSGGAGFTFHHHQGGQSQSYEFPAAGGEPQPPQQPPQENHQHQQQQQHNQNQSQNRNQHQNQPPSPKSNAAAQSKNQNKGNNEEQKPLNPADHPIHKDVKFHAETFIMKTKGKPLSEARIWRNVLRKKFQDEWGPWARNMNMPWDEVPGIDDDDKDRSRMGYDGGSSPRRGGDVKDKSAADYMSEANYDFGEGCSRWKEAGGKMNSSFDEAYERWKKCQGKGGDKAGYNATDYLRAAHYDFRGGYENWKRAGGKMDSSFDEGYAKWKSQHRQDDPDRGTKSSSTRKSERLARKHRRYDSDNGSDYESDASVGP